MKYIRAIAAHVASKKLTWGFLFVLLCVGTVGSAQAHATEYQHVSMIELIANPEKYDKKPVLIQGYLVLEYENNALYLSEWDGQNYLFRNSLWVRLTPDQRKEYEGKSGKIVSAWGEFTKDDHGHMGLYSGGLTKIARIAGYSFK